LTKIGGELIEVRGWKEICEFLGVGDFRTARKILAEKNLLIYECGRPVLNIEAYRIASIQKHESM